MLVKSISPSPSKVVACELSSFPSVGVSVEVALVWILFNSVSESSFSFVKESFASPFASTFTV